MSIMQCNISQDIICAWVDDELPADQCLELTEHAKGCPHCARWRSEFASTKALLRRHVRSAEVPSDFWAQVSRRLDSAQPAAMTVRPARRWQPWTLALAASIALILLGRAAMQVPAPAQPLIPAELVHIYQTHRDSPCNEEHAVSDPIQGARWLTQAVGYNVPTVNYTSAGYELSHVTSCVCFSVNRSVKSPPKGAMMAFRQSNKDWQVCLFVHPTATFEVPQGQHVAIGNESVVVSEDKGCHVISWKSGSRIFSIVSDLPQQELLKLTRYTPN
jgi:hypothetical protein